MASRTAYSLETDVWSLGCMFYTLIVGTPPFEEEGVKLTLDRVIIGEYSLPQSISPEASDLIRVR